MATDAYIGMRFRAVHDWAKGRGVYHAGWPNFHAATYSNPHRTVYGHHLLKDEYVDWRDAPASQVGANKVRERFARTHDYAKQLGYQHGFPNFHQAVKGGGTVHGTHLVPPGTCVFHDVRVADLGMGTGDPTKHPMDRWFTAVADYAARQGYAAAMPTGHYAKYSQGWVIGVMLFPVGRVDWHDIRGRELGLYEAPAPKPLPPPPPPPPPPPTSTIMVLDYNAARITRLGSTQGPWGPASITKVANETPYPIELGILDSTGTTILASAVLAAGASTTAFNGRHPTARWVGVVLLGAAQQPRFPVSPIRVWW